MDEVAVWSLLQCAFPGFTDRALKVLSIAREQADVLHHTLVTPEHVLQALAIEPGVGGVALGRLGIDLQRDAAQITALLPVALPTPPDEYQAFSEEAERLLAQAKAASKELGHGYVDTHHLVLGLLRCGPCPSGNYLRRHGVTADSFREQALTILAG